jgi:signal transduction histidine kinase
VRILIAEDNRVAREALRGTLESWGYEVIAAGDGAEAWDALRQQNAPKLAILDWMMPGVDGLEVCRRARSQPAEDYVYILLLTAKGQKEDIVAGMNAGADDYLTKPFDPEELRARLHAATRIIELKARVVAESRAREEDRRKHFEEMAENRKLAAIGQLAAGIAHEINTPAQYVKANLEFLRESFEELFGAVDGAAGLVAPGRETPPADVVAAVRAALERCDLAFVAREVPQAIGQSAEGVETIARIVAAMRDFARPGSEGKTAVDLNQAVQSALTVCQHEWRDVADVETELAGDLPRVPCAAAEVSQVILHMITNAAHAIADVVGESGRKGLITVRTALEDGWVVIRIADTGAGMSEEVRGRIFEPFFTTREVGEGVGQGLAMAHSVVVTKHAGKLSVRSEVGKGTAFEIRLPTRPADEAEAAAPAAPAAACADTSPR